MAPGASYGDIAHKRDDQMSKEYYIFAWDLLYNEVFQYRKEIEAGEEEKLLFYSEKLIPNIPVMEPEITKRHPEYSSQYFLNNFDDFLNRKLNIPVDKWPHR